MPIRFACPVCQTSYTVNDRCAGKKSECKACGQRLQVPAPQRLRTVLGEELPPAAPPAPEPASVPQAHPAGGDPSPSDEPPTAEVQPYWPPRRPRRRPMPVVKLLMLIATGLWVAAMPGLCLLSYAAGVGGVEEVGGGYVIVRDSRGGGHLMTADSHRAQAMGDAVVAGLCCPTVPYVIAMVALAIIYFATKPERPPV